MSTDDADEQAAFLDRAEAGVLFVLEVVGRLLDLRARLRARRSDDCDRATFAKRWWRIRVERP